jgi:adenylate cyclase
MGRRLAAILVADIVGYSRLMGSDEAGTIRRLKTLRRDLIDPAIKAAHGRIVKTMGDGLLVEFPSPLRAVCCAVHIQRDIAGFEPTLAEDKRFRLRFGINVGDVVAQPDGDLFGDGINVAARLEPLAEPGGLCVSRSVHDQVRDKLPFRFEDRGKLELKNIARPIGVFALSAEAVQALAVPDDEEDEGYETPGANRDDGAPTTPLVTLRPARRVGIVAPALLVSVAAIASVGGLGWSMWPGAIPKAENTLAVQNGLPAKPLPPLSLVVLPFANLSNDPEQEFFADGLTDDLTTDVSHLAGSFVIARNTAFTYKGKPVDVKQLGRDLGVRYALEGSVRRTGEHVVVNAQLISTDTGAHVWADRFEGERSRLGELQVEFVARLARSLDVQLTEAESLRALRDRPNTPDALDLAMRGWAAYNKTRSIDSNNEAISYFEKALMLDPNLPSARLGLARATIIRPAMSWSKDKSKDIDLSDNLINKYLSERPNDAAALAVRGDVYRMRRQFDAARLSFDAAIESNRNYALAHALKGHVSLLAGRADQAVLSELQAIRLSPKDPLLNTWYYFVCHAHTHLQNWIEAISWCTKSVTIAPHWQAYIDLAAAYAWMGKKNEAETAVAELLKLMPGYTVQKWANAGWSDNPKFLEEYAYIVEGLRKAGLPEGATAEN